MEVAVLSVKDPTDLVVRDQTDLMVEIVAVVAVTMKAAPRERPATSQDPILMKDLLQTEPADHHLMKAMKDLTNSQ